MPAETEPGRHRRTPMKWRERLHSTAQFTRLSLTALAAARPVSEEELLARLNAARLAWGRKPLKTPGGAS